MNFGRISDISKLELDLPVDHKANKLILTGKANKPMVYVGCPVWSDRGFVGHLYPKGTKPTNFLAEYAKQFNAIEVNALAYGMKPLDVFRQWKSVATPGFKFCLKLPQTITHRRDLPSKYTETDRFLEAFVEMGDHAGTTLMQLPPHFKPERLEELHQYLKSLPHELTLAVEVRHDSWFQKGQALNELADVLTTTQNSLVITDTPGRRDVLHMRLTMPEVFIRFNGAGQQLWDRQRMDDWVEHLVPWLQNGLQTLYFFSHEPDKPQAAYLSAYLVDKLNARLGMNIKRPQFFSADADDRVG